MVQLARWLFKPDNYLSLFPCIAPSIFAGLKDILESKETKWLMNWPNNHYQLQILLILVPFPSLTFHRCFCLNWTEILSHLSLISKPQTYSNPSSSHTLQSTFNISSKTSTEPIPEFLLLDNKAPLNKFLYKIVLHQTPLCDLCHDDEQDNYHILCNCPLLYLMRSNHFDVFTLRPPFTFHPHKLLSFLLDSDLYNSFID